MVTIIRKHPIWSFIIINYLISWSFLYPSYQLILQNDGITPLALIGLIGAYGPTLAAIIVQYIVAKEDLKKLLKTLVKWKVGFRVLLFMILAPILLYIIAYFFSAYAYDGNKKLYWIQGFSGIWFWVLAALPFGPMGEELGWRGFLLPRLLEKYTAFKSTILVGLAWGVWHLASFTFPGAAIPDFFPVNFATIGLYLINTIALSFVFTYIHFRTNGSVFYAILLHAFFNAASSIVFDFVGETENFQLLASSYILNIVLAGVTGFWLIAKSKS